MSLPFTLMWSLSGSAFVPSSLMTSPLTVTLPATIRSSACLREATPAAEMSFCRRCSIFALPIVECQLPISIGNRQLAIGNTSAPATQVVEILDARQLRQIFQSKLKQKFLRCSVHHRTSDRVFASFRDNQFLVQQGLYGRR